MKTQNKKNVWRGVECHITPQRSDGLPLRLWSRSNVKTSLALFQRVFAYLYMNMNKKKRSYLPGNTQIRQKKCCYGKKMWKPLMNLLALACLRRVFAYPYMNMNQKVVLSSQKIKKNLKHTGEMKEKYDDITHYNKY